VHILELVLDLGPGLTGHLPPDPLAIHVKAKRHHATPAANARPVMDAIPAVAPVVEVDAVLAIPRGAKTQLYRKPTTWLPQWLPKQSSQEQ